MLKLLKNNLFQNLFFCSFPRGILSSPFSRCVHKHSRCLGGRAPLAAPSVAARLQTESSSHSCHFRPRGLVLKRESSPLRLGGAPTSWSPAQQPGLSEPPLWGCCPPGSHLGALLRGPHRQTLYPWSWLSSRSPKYSILKKEQIMSL